jgi:hypothetical protein
MSAKCLRICVAQGGYLMREKLTPAWHRSDQGGRLRMVCAWQVSDWGGPYGRGQLHMVCRWQVPDRIRSGIKICHVAHDYVVKKRQVLV